MVKTRGIIILLCMVLAATAARAGCFARIATDRRSVYIQQPFKVTITVLTDTWFTAPLTFGNLQVPNAFVLPFEQTVPGMFTIGGKQYAGLQFYYIVFPYTSGSFLFPPLTITAETPPVAGEPGRKTEVKTNTFSYTVKQVPDNSAGSNWLVAKNVSVTEHWNKPLQQLKVGDVLERTVSIYAHGTLPQFIPALPEEQLPFADVYLQDAALHDERDEYDANGRLVQKQVYLLEKAGDFVIPALPVTWWNPVSNRHYTRYAAAGNIHVKENPDLGMVTTLKDSMNRISQATAKRPVQKATKRIAGMPWYWFMAILIAAVVLMYYLLKGIMAASRRLRRKYLLYLQSEQHAFRQLKHSSLQAKPFLQHLYRWWDRVAFSSTQSALLPALVKYRQQALAGNISTLLKDAYATPDAAAEANMQIKEQLPAWRREVRLQKKQKQDELLPQHQRELG